MAEQSYTIPATKAPTFWNKDAATGALIGSLIFPIVGTAVGLVIGGNRGQSRMEREQQQGKTVDEPTFWNKQIAVGHWKGLGIGVVVGGVIGLIGGIPGAILGAQIGAGVGSIAGLIVGGIQGKHQMQEEYEQGRALELEKSLSTAQAPSLSQDKENAYTITPEQSKELEDKLAAMKELMSNVDRVQQEPLAPEQGR